MILKVYSKKYGISITDTSHYTENFFRLIHTDKNGIQRPLADIENNGDQCTVFSNSKARIISGKNYHDSMSLTENGLCVIASTASNDIYFLVCENNDDYAGKIKLYSLPANSIITIGYEQCDINYPFELISQRHALLRISNGKLLLEDNNSANGTFVNKKIVYQHEMVPGDQIDLFGLQIICMGSVIVLYSSTIPYSTSSKLLPYQPIYQTENYAQPAIRHHFEDSDILFERSPRIALKQDTEAIQLDAPPPSQQSEEMPLAFTISSSALMSMSSIMMATMSLQNVQANNASMLSALPSIFMAGSMFLGGLAMPIITRKYTDKRAQTKENKRQQKYLNYLEELDSRVSEIGDRQKEYLLKNYPDNAALGKMINDHDLMIWGRMPKHRDFLHLRLGTASQPIDVQINYPKDSFSIEEDVLRDAMKTFENKQRFIENAPFILPLKETGILGIYAEHDIRTRFAQGLLLQLCAQHSYTELKLILIYPQREEKEWEWARWLPHLWSKNHEIRAIATTPDSMRTLSSYIESFHYDVGEQSNVHCVALIADIHLAEQCTALMDSMHSIHTRPLSVIALADQVSQLPKECKSVVTLNETNGYLYRNIDEMETPVSFIQDAVPTNKLREYSTQLSHMHLIGQNDEIDLPDVLPFYAMMRWGNVQQSDLLNRWKKSNPIKTLAAPIGFDTDGMLFSLDIHQNAHGPHGLVAGMTGSGKSELLITYILSIAAHYSPMEVGFVLIDYKGGGMSDTLKRLPHVVGIIDNLGGRVGIRRSMNALSSELKRRQRIFKEVGELLKQSNLDIHRYQELYRNGSVTMPMQHIIIISDEFAELKQQEPEFMDDLVSAARIGRSLGIHLILATQKPAGVVNDQILSNTRFRICLKVQEKGDSMSMLSRPEAASLTKTGRFYMQVGYNEIFSLGQSAWSGAPSIPMERYTELPDDFVELLDDLGKTTLKTRLPQKQNHSAPIKQVDELVQHIHDTASAAALIPQAIWPPMLQDNELLDDIDANYKPSYNEFHIDPVVGLVDDPFLQIQYPLQLDITANGNAIIYGVVGSGKSNFICAAIYSLCMHHQANELNIYCLDFASESTKMFSNMPQVGDVIVAGEDEKLDKFIHYLQNEITRRRKLLADYNGSLSSYRLANNAQPLPNILLVVDNYTSFNEGYEEYSDIMYQIIREGQRFGIYAIITCVSNTSIRFRMTQNFQQIFCMQMPDKSDYSLLLGTASEALPMNRSGSGVYRNEHVLEFQVAKIRNQEDAQLRQTMLALGNEQFLNASVHKAHKIELLPEVITAQLLCEKNQFIPLSAVPVGMEHTDLSILHWNLNSHYLNGVFFNSLPEYPFMQSLACILHHANNRKILFLDALDNSEWAENSILYYGALNIEKGVRAAFDEVLMRHNTIHDARQEGKNIPAYEEYVILINGLAELYEAIKPLKDLPEMLDAILLRGSRALNMCVIYSLDAAKISAVSTKEWYRKSPVTEGVWLGAGIKKQYILPTDSIRSNEKLPEGTYGYLIGRGRHQCGKMVSAKGGSN